MSSLGTKVKEFLRAGDSEEAKRGEVDRNTPGSFPADDMQPAGQPRALATGHEHNKLHKPNDPRGWTENQNTPRDSAYQGSDVGLGEARTQPSCDSTQQSTLSTLEKPCDTIAEPRERTSERLHEPTTSGGLETSANAAPQQHFSRSTEPAVPSTDAQEHPYWGELPPNSVQQTIPGHDTANEEDKDHKKPALTAPLESGTFTNRRDPSEATHFSSTQPGDQQQPYESTSGSRFKEGAGVGAVVAGTGAYELNKKHRADGGSGRVEPATGSTRPEEHKGRSFPLLNREHKEKEKDAHHIKEKHPHYAREVQEDKHAKEPKPEHESKISGMFHKGYKDETKPEPQGDRIEDKHHRTEAAPALATAGVGGATAYAATRDRHGEHQPQDVATPKELKDDKYEKEPKHDSKFGGLFHRRHIDKGEVDFAVQKEPTEDKHHQSKAGTGLATGGAAGAAGAATHTATRDRHDGHQPQDTVTSSRYDEPTAPRGTDQHLDSNHPEQVDHHSGTTQLPIARQFTSAGKHSDVSQRRATGQPSNLGAAGAFGFQGTQPTAHSMNYSPAQGYQPEGSHSHRDTKLATGAAAGLGAEALASHELNKRQNDKYAMENTPSNHQSGQTASLGTEPFASQGLNERRLHDQYTAKDNSRQYQSGQHQPGQTLSNEAFASRGLDNRQPNEHCPAEDTSRQYQPVQYQHSQTGPLGTRGFESSGLENEKQSGRYITQPDSRQRQYEADQTGSMGTTSLVSDAREPGLGSSRNEPISRSVETTQHRRDDELPIFTQNANAGKYDTLASGTPSGLRTENSSDNAGRS